MGWQNFWFCLHAVKLMEVLGVTSLVGRKEFPKWLWLSGYLAHGPLPLAGGQVTDIHIWPQLYKIRWEKNYTTLDEKTGRSLGWLWCFWTRLAFPNWIFKEWVSICISEAQTYALSVSTSGLTGLENSLESFFSSWIFCSIKVQSSIDFPLKIIIFWMFTHVLMFNVVIDHTAHVISRMGFVGFSNDLLEGWRA